VLIKINDMLGKEVTTLINELEDVGYHIVYWNGEYRLRNSAASGVYLYKSRISNFVQTKMMGL